MIFDEAETISTERSYFARETAEVQPADLYLDPNLATYHH